MKTILITGGAGFIGSHVVRLFLKKYPNNTIVNIDCLTYAGNLENLSDIDDLPNYIFEKTDIRDAISLDELFEKYNPDTVIHLAAESHVDRSITNPMEFVETNVVGTVNLLNSARNNWRESFEDKLFYHVSTDEVFGALGQTGLFTEETPYSPNSPYSASKAASDHFVRAYHETYGMPIVISNCSNNYGPNQFPEKLIPLMISNILNGKKLPVYGDGKYTRDWLYVEDHALAIETVYRKGTIGETYCIGGWNELQNIVLINQLCDLMDNKLKLELGTSKKLITFVKDRPGHDKRYAIDARKMEKELGWKPKESFKSGIKKTIDWYLDNEAWLKNITSGAYQDYYSSQYKK
ncbi:MAG: dTDP-glucose 4,6-dehydratase [Owenweeksia sp. TMED14]|nr:MAG: dTDP-glucose 4,6-dehydratase [Owenweeksia sp. TMED14]